MLQCTKCRDTGKIGVETIDRRVVAIGGGMTMGPGTSYSTHLCECRRNLPPRQGKARWWSHGKGYSESLVTCADWFTMEVSLTPELPISEDGYPLLRTWDNCYFGCRIGIDIEGDSVLTPDDLRQLAAFLVRMADRADEMDRPADKTPKEWAGIHQGAQSGT